MEYFIKVELDRSTPAECLRHHREIVRGEFLSLPHCEGCRCTAEPLIPHDFSDTSTCANCGMHYSQAVSRNTHYCNYPDAMSNRTRGDIKDRSVLCIGGTLDGQFKQVAGDIRHFCARKKELPKLEPYTDETSRPMQNIYLEVAVDHYDIEELVFPVAGADQRGSVFIAILSSETIGNAITRLLQVYTMSLARAAYGEADRDVIEVEVQCPGHDFSRGYECSRCGTSLRFAVDAHSKQKKKER